MENKLIRVEDVSREFYRKNETIHAVSHVSLGIEKGTFNILCGRSGSGKTTLVNMMSAIDLPTSGEVYFDEKSITEMSVSRRDALRRKQVGIVFQNTALIAQMSALENIEFALSIAGVKTKQRKGNAIQWLDKVGMKERRNHMPGEMSGGEQARIAICRALAHRPDVLFADEPTSELDSATSYKIVQMFRDLVNEEGLTIVMTTHDVNIMDVADTIFTMEDGVIIDVRKN